MNNFWKAAFLLGAFVAAAQCLICQKCPDDKSAMCLLGSNVTCNASCFAAEETFPESNATGQVTLYIRGCMDSDLCEKELNDRIYGITSISSYNVTKCCKTDLCNGATSVQLSLTVALCAAVLSFLSGL